MAVFGGVFGGGDGSLDCFRSCLELLWAMQAVNQGLEQAGFGKTKFRLSVGMNTGLMYLGVIGGSKDALGVEIYDELTAIGDTVNVAARCQDLAGAKEIILPSRVVRESGAILDILNEQAYRTSPEVVSFKYRGLPWRYRQETVAMKNKPGMVPVIRVSLPTPLRLRRRRTPSST